MLNRTNRTLSAHSNRLNLGTRSLAIVSVNGKNSLRLRPAHGFPVRAEMLGNSEPRLAVGILSPSISGSTPPASSSVPDVVMRPAVVVDVVLMRSDLDTKAAFAACPAGSPSFPTQAWHQHAGPARAALTAKRRAVGRNARMYRAYNATTIRTAAAIAAAAGG